MISLCENCDFSILVADMIEKMSSMDLFVVKIWLNNAELPFIFDSDHDFYFMQEGIRISTKKNVMYIFYDVITFVKIIGSPGDFDYE